MSSKKNKVLFISHDASRTGAPIVFLHLLRWLKANSNLEINILLLADGPLKQDFEAIGKTFLWDPDPTEPGLKKLLIRKILKRDITVNPRYFVPFGLRNVKYDLIYANTVASHHALPFLKQFYKSKVISHVHENEYTIKTFYKHSMDMSFTNCIDHYIAVSKSTVESLVNFAIPIEKISLIYEFVSVEKVLSLKAVDGDIIKDRHQIGNSFIVGGSGLTSWRKGVDLFIQTMLLINQKRPDNNIKFVWVGAQLTEFKLQFEYEATRLEKYHLDGKIIFIDSVPQPQDYFQLFDIFYLSSREDPFPLVMLENAALGKPVFCFANSGGAEEFVSGGAGVLIRYGDVNLMADAILSYSTRLQDLKSMGEKGKNKIEDYDVAAAAAKILKVINTQIEVNA